MTRQEEGEGIFSFLFVPCLFFLTVQSCFSLASAVSSYNNSWIYLAAFPTLAELGYGSTSETSAPASTPFRAVRISAPLVFPLGLQVLNTSPSSLYFPRPKSVAAFCNRYLHHTFMLWQGNLCPSCLWLLLFCKRRVEYHVTAELKICTIWPLVHTIYWILSQCSVLAFLVRKFTWN